MMYRFNGWMKEKVNHHTFEKKKQWCGGCQHQLTQETFWANAHFGEIRGTKKWQTRGARFPSSRPTPNSMVVVVLPPNFGREKSSEEKEGELIVAGLPAAFRGGDLLRRRPQVAHS
jgi:hypothetical protein